MNSNLSKIYYNNPISSTESSVTITPNQWFRLSEVGLMTYKNVPQIMSLNVINAQNNGAEICLGIGTDNADIPDLVIGTCSVSGWKSASGILLINNTYDRFYNLFIKSSGSSISYPSMQYIALNLPKN